MGCGCSSNSVPSSFNFTAPQAIPVSNVPCEKTREEIEALAAKAECVKRTNPTVLLNAILGQLYSMLNLGEYCKFDIDYIKTYLNNEQDCP